MVMYADLNGAGTLFGGRALAWIDEEAAVFAACQLGTSTLVTKAISAIDFIHPARLGDIVEIGTELVSIGRTSITVKCSIRNKNSLKEIVKATEIVFVHINEDGFPTPHGKTLDNVM